MEKKLRFHVIDAYKVARDAGMGGRINTVMQTCFFALSGVLPRDEAIAQIKGAIEKTYGKRGAEVVKRNFAAVDATLAHLHEVPRARRHPGDPRAAAPRGRGGARLRAAGHRGDDGRQGRPPARERVPGGRHLARRHGAVGEAQHRPRDPGLGREDLHPVQQVRARLPARRHPGQGLRPEALAGAPATFKADRPTRARLHGPQVHDPGGAGGLHRLHPVRRGLPGQGQVEPAAQGHRHGAAGAAARRRSGRTTPSSSTCPRSTARTRSTLDLKSSQFLRAALRVLGRLRRLRRDAVHQAADPALRRPRRSIANATGCSSIYGGNLPTTPYTTNRDGRGPGLVELAVRGQRRVRPRHAAGARLAPRAGGRSCCSGSRGADRRAAWSSTLLDGGPGRRGRHRGAARARVRALRSRLAGDRTAPRRGASSTLADYLVQARASGSSAATAGPTTSATAASTTSCRAAAT